MPIQKSAQHPSTRRYSDTEKAQAVRLVGQLRAELGTDHGTVKRVAGQLGYGTESVRAWVRQADIDDGGRPGTTTGDRERLKVLESGGARAATGECDLEVGVGFLRGGARPPTQMMVAFIRRLPRGLRGRADLRAAADRPVELLRRQVAACVGSGPPPCGDDRGAGGAVGGELPGIWGATKLWLAARRAGHEIGRDQVAALMRAAGICGVTRRRRARTTVRDPGAERPGDLVNRDFTARSPNRLWVTDLTVVSTRTGAAYVCFIVDAFSRLIVGWRVAAHMRTEMVLDAVEMARRGRGARIEGLTVHSDAGSQFTSIRYTERLAELGAAPSVGSVGDSYDNALAETVIGLYKSELIRGPRQGPWDSAADVELATLGWVHWHNHQRLHTYLGDVPPAEFEAAYAALQPDHQTVGNQ